MAIAQTPTRGAVAIRGEPAAAGLVTAHIEDMDVAPVKGVPFCTTVTTEHTQAFADGNRIHTTDNSSLCRDGQGRTRREAGLNLLGAAPEPAPPKLITIVDSVAGFRYVLDPENKIAHKFPISTPGPKSSGIPDQAVAPGKGERVMIYQRVGASGPSMVASDDVLFKKAGDPGDEPAPTRESLGDQTIEGLRATGSRITTTIPAGRMGNEQPIAIISERWYSPELKATVMTKHTDPWAGELKTQFTNLNTSEPDASLFVVPSDYKVVNEKAGPFVLQNHVTVPPPPPQ
jgi:hypothetical protein